MHIPAVMCLLFMWHPSQDKNMDLSIVLWLVRIVVVIGGVSLDAKFFWVLAWFLPVSINHFFHSNSSEWGFFFYDHSHTMDYNKLLHYCIKNFNT